VKVFLKEFVQSHCQIEMLDEYL